MQDVKQFFQNDWLRNEKARWKAGHIVAVQYVGNNVPSCASGSCSQTTRRHTQNTAVCWAVF